MSRLEKCPLCGKKPNYFTTTMVYGCSPCDIYAGNIKAWNRLARLVREVAEWREIDADMRAEGWGEMLDRLRTNARKRIARRKRKGGG